MAFLYFLSHYSPQYDHFLSEFLYIPIIRFFFPSLQDRTDLLFHKTEKHDRLLHLQQILLEPVSYKILRLYHIL